MVEKNAKNAIKVPITTLDAIIKQYKIKHIRLLKIDIEGYELFALRGANNVLDICDILFFESWETHFKGFNYSTKDILGLLKEKQFFIYRFDNEKLVDIGSDYVSKDCENLIAFRNKCDINCIYEKN